MNESVRSRGRRARRTANVRYAFCAHLLGTYAENAVSRLKERLHGEGLLEAEDSKLDLVLVDDIEHYYELLSEHGIPLARNEDMLFPARRRVRFTVHPCLFAIVVLMLLALLIDDFVKLATGFDLIPYF